MYLLVEDGENKGIRVIRLTAQLRPSAQGYGQRVCSLMDKLIFLIENPGHVLEQTFVIVWF